MLKETAAFLTALPWRERRGGLPDQRQLSGPPKANPAEVLDSGEAEVRGAGSGGLEQQVWAWQVHALCLELVWLPWGGEEWSPCPFLLY